MNKEYIQTSSGDIVVFNENLVVKEVPFTDNLDEILVQENVIETIEKRIGELENELEDIYGVDSQEKVNNRKYFPLALPTLTISVLLSPIFLYYTGSVDIFTTITNSIFGQMTEAVAQVLSFLTIFTPFGAIIDYIMYRDHKINIKDFNGKTSQLEALERLLSEEKIKLEKLNLDRTSKKDNKQFRIVPVEYQKQLDILENFSAFHYNLGYDLDTYYKALQNGTLETLLQQEGYKDETISTMTDYVKSKGPVLARRKTKLPKNTRV